MRFLSVSVAFLALVAGIVTVTATAAVARPSRAQIDAVMKRTVEVRDRSVHFATLGRPIEVTVGDGKGGSLTAVLGTRSPTADGYGQLVFFWHNGRFIGWNSRFEAIAVISIKAVGATVQIRFAHYRRTDAFCCPSLPPVTVGYRWSGHGSSPAASRRETSAWAQCSSCRAETRPSWAVCSLA